MRSALLLPRFRSSKRRLATTILTAPYLAPDSCCFITSSSAKIPRRQPTCCNMGIRIIGSQSFACYCNSPAQLLSSSMLSSSQSPARQQRFFSSSSSSSSRKKFKSAPPSTNKVELQHQKRARELLDKRLHPEGSYKPEHFNDAKKVLDFFKQANKKPHAESVNLSLALLERLVLEIAAVKRHDAIKNDLVKQDQYPWVCDAVYFNPLFAQWKAARLDLQKVASPKQVYKKLLYLHDALPGQQFQYDIVTIELIKDVLLSENQEEEEKAKDNQV